MEIIKFNKKIYTLEAVQTAIKEFENLAAFSLKEVDNYIEVIINNMDNDFENVLPDEFANYVLGLLS